jgi:hypothetical protein
LSKYDHNVRQIKNSLFRGEVALKGTAPSYLNLESDKEKPGSISPLSQKGYDHLEAVAKTEDNSGIPEEEMAQYSQSIRKLEHALAHVRRTKFDLYRAILRVQNDPGIIKRWENGTEQDSPDWLRSYEMACKEAAEYIEGIWPGTRLYIPTKREDDQVESKLHARNQDNNDAKRHDAWDRYFDLNAEIEGIAEQEQCSLDAALGVHRDRLEKDKQEDVSPATFWRARNLVLTIRGISQSEGCTLKTAKERYRRALEEKGKSA